MHTIGRLRISLAAGCGYDDLEFVQGACRSCCRNVNQELSSSCANAWQNLLSDGCKSMSSQIGCQQWNVRFCSRSNAS